MPAPIANKNATKHGLHGLTTGSLPPGCSYVRKKLGKLEQQLSQAVMEKHGEISIINSALIQSAVRHEARAALIMRWMRKGAATMTDLVKLQFVRDLSAATDARDRCIRQLNIESTERSVIDSLYGAAPALAFDESHDVDVVQDTKSETHVDTKTAAT